jgi:hypothetical protein
MPTLQTNSQTQMTLHEKRAWFNLAVFALALTAFFYQPLFLGIHSRGLRLGALRAHRF